MTPDPIVSAGDLSFRDYRLRPVLRAAFQPGPFTAVTPTGLVSYPDGGYLVQDGDDDRRFIVVRDTKLFGLLYAEVGAGLPDTAEGLAQLLAEKSRLPRYSDVGIGWRALLGSVPNIRHAAAAAATRGFQDALLAAERLLAMLADQR